MGVRPTQLTIKKSASHKFRPDYYLFKMFKICINVEMCELCRPDTHALQIRNYLKGSDQANVLKT